MKNFTLPKIYLLMLCLFFTGLLAFISLGNNSFSFIGKTAPKDMVLAYNSEYGFIKDRNIDLFNSSNGTVKKPVLRAFANEIKLVKTIEDTAGTPVSSDIALGGELVYVLSYQNTSGSAINNYSITDVIPNNLTLIGTDMPGSSVYNPNTRLLTISIGNLAPNKSGTVKVRVQVSNNTNNFRDACSTFISNQAYSNYNGIHEASFANFTDITAAPSIFSLSTSSLNATRTEVLCGSQITISAGSGFDSYAWTKNGAYVGNTKDITVNSIGKYIVTKTVTCNGQTISYKETINVYQDGTISNPIIPYADDIGTCANDGSKMPNILLCGTEESRLIETNFINITTLTWQKLSGSCTTFQNCPNTSGSCWSNIGSGAEFEVSDAGQYRIVLTYQNGCQDRFYFNVYKDQLNASVTTEDYTVDHLGSITINAGGVGPQYTYQITDSNGVNTSYGPTSQNQHTFTNLAEGSYTINVSSDTGCSYNSTVIIADLNPMWFTADYFNMKGCNSAKIQVQRGGGSSPYQFTIWSINGVPLYDSFDDIPLSAFSNEGSESVGGAQSRVFYVPISEQGDYVFIMRDSKGDFAISNVETIALDPKYNFIVQTENVSCYGFNDGSVSLEFTTNEQIDVKILLYNGDTYVEGGSNTPIAPLNTSGTFPNLAAGNYTIEVTIHVKKGNSTCTFIRNFEITQPDAALEAFAGVSTDVSCLPDVGASEVRITNASGGTPPYQYNIDGTWTTSNVGYRNNDGYVYIRDANGCIHEMYVDVNAASEIPEIVSDVDYNCDGTGNISLTANISSPNLTYIYQYSLDGALPQQSNEFNNLAPGNYTVTVYYENTTPDNPTPGILLEEDFGTGSNTTNANVNPAYIYESQIGQDNANGDADNMLDDGEYVVTNSLKILGGQQWVSPLDAAGEAGGRYLAVNIGDAAGVGGIIYEKQIKDISNGADILVDISVFNLLYASSNQGDPDIIIQLVDNTGQVVSQDNTGAINNDEQWHPITLTLNSGGNSELTFRIRSSSIVFSGNDIAIDGLRVYQVPIICTAQVEVPIVVEESQALSGSITAQNDATCFGNTDGSLTFEVVNFDPLVGFEYSLDGGATWILSTSSPITIPNLAPGDVQIMVKDANNDSCNFTLQTQTPIGQPQQLIVTPDVTQEVSCDPVNPGAIITVTAEGGTSPYEYGIDNGSGAGIQWQPNNVFQDVLAGTYTFYVRDANGCMANTTVPLTINNPEALTFTVNSTLCYDGSNGQISVNVTNGNGNYQFSLNGTTWFNADVATPNQYTFTNVTPGSYTVYVKDGYSCQANQPATINPQIGLSITSQSNVSCSGYVDGSATLTVTDFIPPYGYTVNGSGGASNLSGSTFNLPNLNEGAYVVLVTDANGCTATATVTIDAPASPLDATLEVTPMSCSTPTPIGSVRVNVTGGYGSYQYTLALNGSTIAGPQNNSLFNNLTATGNYTVTITDAGGCSIIRDFTLSTPVPPTLSLSSTGCYNGLTNVTITATPTGGVGPYQYSLNGGSFQSGDTFSVAPGTYTVTVRDSLDCEDDETITIDQQLQVSATAGVIPACGSPASTDVTITASGGDGNYVYAVITGTSPADSDFDASNNPFNVTSPGTYNVYVRDHSGTAGYCEAVTQVIITQDAAVDYTESHTDVDCFGGSDGTISLVGTGGTAPYTYHIVNAAASIDITKTTGGFVNLPAGTYDIMVTDNNGCTDIGDITITEPAEITATITPTAYTCLTDASITISANGGSGSFEYSVNGSAWQSSNVFNGIEDGTHIIRIRDANAIGCYITETITIAPLPIAPTLSAAVDYNCDGTGNITVSPNNPSYTYSIDGVTFGPSNIFTNRAPGSYVITVNYGSDCTATVPVTVQSGQALAARITGVTHVSCNGGSDGTLTFEVSNFDPVNGYDYSVERSSVVVASGNGSSAATQTIPNLPAGTYTIVITDPSNAGCSVTLTETIVEPALLAVTLAVSHMTCNNSETATITATASGGSGSYEYQLENSLGVVAPYQASNSFTVTGAANVGNYTVVVRDANSTSCTAPAPVTIDAPETIAFTATPTVCYSGNSDGEIVVNVTWGNGGYQFSINGGPWLTPSPATATTYTFTNLTNGTYSINVKDAYGCTGTPVNVTINPQLLADAVLNADLVCGTNAQVTVNASGGDGAYAYGWANSTAGPFSSTGFIGNVFTTGTAGTYYFQVTDGEGCTVVDGPITITPATQPVISSVTPTNILCSGDFSGALDVVIDTSFGTGPYTITVINTDTGTNYATQTTNLPAGNYSVTVTDSKGCVSNPVTATITEPAPLNPVITANPIQCTASGTSLGSVVVDIPATGGTAPFEVTLYTNTGALASTSSSNPATAVTSGSSVTFNDLNFGDYTIRIVDANGCETVENITVTTYTDVIISTQGAAGCGPGSGSMTITANTTAGTLGTGNFWFAIYPAVPWSNTSPDWNLGTPTTIPDPVTGNPVNTSEYTFNNLTPGVTYTFIVYDEQTDCEYIQEATVPVLATSTLSATIDTVTPVSCTGSGDGSVTFTVTGFDGGATSIGYEVFEYVTNNAIAGTTGSVSTTPTPVTATINNLPPGEYYILFTENGGANNGCVNASATFVITQSAALLEVSATAENDNCNTNAGVITAGVRYGTGPYEFSLDNVTYTTASTFDVESGNYTVYVRDANGCVQSTPVTVGLDPSPVISAAVNNNCAAEGNYSVTVSLTTAGMQPYSISVNGSAFQNITFTAGTYQITGLNSGLGQTVSVRDVNGCIASDSFDIAPPLQFNAQLKELLDCQPGDENAEITFNISGGTSATLSNITYDVDGPAGFTDLTGVVFTSNPLVFDGANVAGDYIITVNDISTGCSVTRTVNVPARVEPDPSISSFTNVTCNGADDGTITVSAADNGIGPFSFEITNAGGSPVSIPPTTTNGYTATFTGLAGVETTGINYTITVTSTANSCATTVSQVITQPAPIVVPNPSDPQFVCTSGNTNSAAIVEVNTAFITGGSGNYIRYDFVTSGGTVLQSSPSPRLVFSNYAGATIEVRVYDSNGCLGTSIPVTVDPFIQLDSITVTPTDPTCNTGDGQIVVDAVLDPLSATTNLQYELFDMANTSVALNTINSTNIQETFGGLDVANYLIRVTNTDTGCYLETTAQLRDPDTFDLDINVVTDVTCEGTASGIVDLILTDEYLANGDQADPFDYTITGISDPLFTASGNSGLGTTAQVTGLPEGSYTVTVTLQGAPFCSVTKTFSILGPGTPITASTIVTAITCNPGDDGVIEITASGGWGGYQYYVGLIPPTPADYVSNPRFENLSPDTYQVWVKDSNGCDLQILPDVTLVDPTPITATINPIAQNCNGTNGQILVDNVAGGQGSNYTFQLIKNGTNFGTPKTGSTALFTGLGAGSYTVRIHDQWGCEVILNTPVTLYEVIALSYNIDTDISCDISNANTGGQVTITATGGTGDFNYSVAFPDASIVDNVGDNKFTGLDQAGTYTFTVTDNVTLCVKTIGVILDAPVIPVIANVVPTNETCFGNDGTITVTMDPATETDPPYTYVLTQGATVIDTNYDGLFTGLAAGTYDVRVTSALGCSVPRNNIVIGTDPTPQISLAVTDNCDVSGGFDITVTLDQAGIAPYNLSVNGAIRNVTFNAINQYVITGLTAGSYDIQVLDVNGCGMTVNNNIVITPLDFSAQVTTLLDCEATPADNAEITINSITGSGIYEYEIDGPGTADQIRTSLPSTGITWNLASLPGDYRITVYDMGGSCSIKKTVTVPEKPEPQISVIYSADEICEDSQNGQIVVRAVDNGIGPFTFAIIAASDSSVTLPIAPSSVTGYTATFTGLNGSVGGITYTIEAIAANSCPVDIDQIIYAPEPVQVVAVNVTPFSCTTGSNINNHAVIEVGPAQVTGGSGSYTRFQFIHNGIVVQNGSNPRFLFTDLAGGDVTVNVYDNKGCMGTIDTTIAPFIGISDPVVTVIDPITCDNGEEIQVSVTVIPLTAAPTLEYMVVSADGTSYNQTNTDGVFTNLRAGGYFVTVRNVDTGCEVTVAHNVSQPNTFAITAIESNPVECYDTATGSVDLTLIDRYLANGDQSGSFEYIITNVNDPSFSISGTSNTNNIVVPNIPAGAFEVTAIITANGLNCIINPTRFSISQSVAPLTVTAEEVSNVTCTNDKGEIYVNPTGGYAPYTIVLTDTATGNVVQSASGVTGYVFIGLSAGTYTATVTDTGNCTVIPTDVTLIRPDFIEAEITKVDILCNGSNTGEVSATNVTGGAGIESYYYILNDITNGTSSEAQEEPVFTGLPVGTYSISVIDAWDCDFTTGQVDIEQPNPIIIEETAKSDLVCFGESNGFYDMSISGGQEPYSITLTEVVSGREIMNDPNIVNRAQVSFSNLEGDIEYKITVVDANGCPIEKIIMIPKGPDLSAKVAVEYGCEANLPSNWIEVALTNPNMDPNEVMYALNSNDINNALLFDEVVDGKGIVNNVAPGVDQWLTIFYEGCSQIIAQEERFTIEQIDQLLLTDTSNPNSLNLISVNPSGGVAPYTFYFNDRNNGNNTNYYVSINDPGYTNAEGNIIKVIDVTVIDANGCEYTIQVEKEFIDIKIPDHFTPDGDGNNDEWGPENDEGFPTILVKIYDRYGRVVAELRVGRKWDGRYNGAPLPTGDYWYVVKPNGPNDPREFVGHFTLYRSTL